MIGEVGHRLRTKRRNVNVRIWARGHDIGRTDRPGIDTNAAPSPTGVMPKGGTTSRYPQGEEGKVKWHSLICSRKNKTGNWYRIHRGGKGEGKW